jgi:hypothetical protein
MPGVNHYALAVALCAAGALAASLLLHYDYGYRVVNYTGPPLPLAVVLSSACPVSGSVEVDGQLVPLRCGYVAPYYRYDDTWYPVRVWADAPRQPVDTWILLIGDDAAYMLETRPPGDPGCVQYRWYCRHLNITGHAELPPGCSYVVYGGRAYALLRAPTVSFVVEFVVPGDIGVATAVETYVLYGVPEGAVRALRPAACRAVEKYRLFQGMMRLESMGDLELPLYVVGVEWEPANLTRFVGVTAQQSPDAWPLFEPRIAAG